MTYVVEQRPKKHERQCPSCDPARQNALQPVWIVRFYVKPHFEEKHERRNLTRTALSVTIIEEPAGTEIEARGQCRRTSCANM